MLCAEEQGGTSSCFAARGSARSASSIGRASELVWSVSVATSTLAAYARMQSTCSGRGARLAHSTDLTFAQVLHSSGQRRVCVLTMSADVQASPADIPARCVLYLQLLSAKKAPQAVCSAPKYASQLSSLDLMVSWKLRRQAVMWPGRQRSTCTITEAELFALVSARRSTAMECFKAPERFEHYCPRHAGHSTGGSTKACNTMIHCGTGSPAAHHEVTSGLAACTHPLIVLVIGTLHLRSQHQTTQVIQAAEQTRAA